jgi:hypothetical protein
MSGSDESPAETTEATKIGIPIPTQQFKQLVTSYLARMKKNAALEAEDFITMTRLWNTITFQRLGKKDELFSNYADLFFPAYVERIARVLEALPTKGMALYSKSYDLYLGGQPHQHSQYRLERKR